MRSASTGTSNRLAGGPISEHDDLVLASKAAPRGVICLLSALAARAPLDGGRLARALSATFERRRTPLPVESPVALTAAFAQIEGKRAQWAGFLGKNRLAAAPADLASPITGIAAFVGPVLAASARSTPFAGNWPPGGPWR